jgi:hypothetical protein
LDECNGRFGPDGTYRYHATATFPYILGCYRGTANGAGGGGEPVDPGGGGQPPAEATAACAGLAAGAGCSFAGRGGARVEGTCNPVNGVLACVPAGGPPRP